MNLRITLFALARELYGNDTIAVDVPAGTTVGDLRTQLLKEIPALAPLMKATLIAVNSDYTTDQKPLADGDEVACIPPVSGG